MINTIAFANMAACFFGILVSFLGNKYVVFKSVSGNLSGQFIHFSLLYSFVAIFHGIFIYIWADFNGFNYRVGFLIATALQFLITYNYNKVLIFKK